MEKETLHNDSTSPIYLEVETPLTADILSSKEIRKEKLIACLKYLIPICSVIGGSLLGPISNLVPCEEIFLK